MTGLELRVRVFLASLLLTIAEGAFAAAKAIAPEEFRTKAFNTN